MSGQLLFSDCSCFFSEKVADLARRGISKGVEYHDNVSYEPFLRQFCVDDEPAAGWNAAGGDD